MSKCLNCVFRNKCYIIVTEQEEMGISQMTITVFPLFRGEFLSQGAIESSKNGYLTSTHSNQIDVFNKVNSEYGALMM